MIDGDIKMGEYGEFIKKKRGEKKISLRQMARDLNISVSYLSDLEQGIKLPPNSKDDNYKDLVDRIFNYLSMSDEEKNHCLDLSDKELINKGHVSNDITDYMGKTPMATMALRRAKENNLTDDDWKKIFDNMNK